MDNIWREEFPDAEGWYWVEWTHAFQKPHESTERVILQVRHLMGKLHLMGLDFGDLDGPDSFDADDVRKNHRQSRFRFGPAVPSAEELASGPAVSS